MRDPLRQQRQRLALMTIATGLVVASVAWWAFRPLPQRALPVFESAAADVLARAEVDIPLDDVSAEAFNVVLWPAPEAEVVAEAQSPKPATPRGPNVTHPGDRTSR